MKTVCIKSLSKGLTNRCIDYATCYCRSRCKTTYTDVGSADIAGANICHPCKLDSSIPAADGPAIACRIVNNLIALLCR